MNQERISQMVKLMESKPYHAVKLIKKTKKELEAILRTCNEDLVTFPRSVSIPATCICEIARDLFWMYARIRCPREFCAAGMTLFDNCSHPFPTVNQIKCIAVIESQFALEKLYGHIEIFCKVYEENFNDGGFRPRSLLHLTRCRLLRSDCLGPVSEGSSVFPKLNLPQKLERYLIQPTIPAVCSQH